MAKLHELLAVESNLKGQAEKLRQDLMGTFEKKRHLFEETRKTYTAKEENSKTVVEEQKEIQTTVANEIAWISTHMAKAIDAGYHIDTANTQAFADVVIEDEETAILKQVPATALLQLEKRLKDVQALIQAIPTLDPAKGFQLDTEHAKKGVYKARDVVKPRMKKEPKVITLAPATDKFQAQTQLLSVDEPVGEIREQEWSAMLTPSTKTELLDRVEKTIRSVTRARARANEQEVDVHGNKVGKKLLDYIFQPLQS